MDEASGPTGRHLDELERRRTVAAQAAGGPDDLRQVAQACERMNMSDDHAVGHSGVLDEGERPPTDAGLIEQPSRAGASSGHSGVKSVVHRVGHDSEHWRPILDEGK